MAQGVSISKSRSNIKNNARQTNKVSEVSENPIPDAEPPQKMNVEGQSKGPKIRGGSYGGDGD